MKVLHIIKLSGLGGAEVYLSKALPALNQRGVQSTLLAMINTEHRNGAMKVIQLMKDQGIEIIELDVTSDFSLKMYRAIADIIKNGAFDLVNAHLIHAELYATMVKRLLIKDLKIVSTKHGYSPEYQVKYGFEPVKKIDKFWLISRFVGWSMNRTISISKGLKRLIVALNIAKEQDVDVIHYGFDYGQVNYDSNIEKYRKAPQQILILGRLEEVKGHTMAFQAMPKIVESFPDAKIVIIGSGIIEEQLKKEVVERNLNNNVEFLGFQTAIHDFIHNSDIVLIPSFAEGFCAVVLEAYYNRVPVVCFDVPALNEIVFDNVTGHIIPKFDISILSEKIIQILKDKEGAKQLADNGYEKLMSYFNIERMTNQTIESYQKVFSNKK